MQTFATSRQKFVVLRGYGFKARRGLFA